MGLPKRIQPASRHEFTDWQSRMRTAFFEAVSENDMREIVEGLVAKAKAGDLAAVRILLSYGIGSPSVKIKNAVVVQQNQDLAPLPTAPCKLMPGDEKIDVLSKRAANGQALFDPRDKARDLD